MKEVVVDRKPTGKVGKIGNTCLGYLGKYIKYQKDEDTFIHFLVQDLEEDYEEYTVPLDSEEIIEVGFKDEGFTDEEDVEIIKLIKPGINENKFFTALWVDGSNINNISIITEDEYLNLRNYITK